MANNNEKAFNVHHILALCLFCFALTLLSGCGDQGPHPSTLLGKWLQEGGGRPVGFELLKDGAGTAGKTRITWKVENGRLYLSEVKNDEKVVLDYKISGSTLTLTGDDERNVIFKRATGHEKEWQNRAIIQGFSSSVELGEESGTAPNYTP
ncbi:MAG: lipocalin family protein [Phycisphaerales bacterium]|nr:lipocalin family protein [Phycisphaerales bacterium]